MAENCHKVPIECPPSGWPFCKLVSASIVVVGLFDIPAVPRRASALEIGVPQEVRVVALGRAARRLELQYLTKMLRDVAVRAALLRVVLSNSP